jgi:hypothetical protein
MVLETKVKKIDSIEKVKSWLTELDVRNDIGLPASMANS